MKYLCDQMLGTLATWLRLIGFDTFFPNDKTSDDEILEISKKENRVLISRDKELIIRAKKRNIKNIQLETVDLDEQLEIVLKNDKIDEKKILSRCSICNTLVKEINKVDIEDKIPEKVYLYKEKFWICPKCNKIYWKGSHYNKILKKIKDISKDISN